MADFGVTGEVVVTSEKAEAAFDRVGDKATQMANEVASAAGKAGQAVDGVGAGAEKSAEKFTRAESRMRDAIKRSTQELQLLGKTASEKLEFNIQAKGLDASKFAPYIEELKKAEAAQKIATGSLDKMGVSAAQTAAALRGVPAQFTDIITSLQGGQAPLTVFLQQGGQLKDMFGGAGNAARALGGYVLGLINPFTLAAATVAGIAVAYNQGSKESEAFNKTLIMTGNAAGTSADSLADMARAIDATSIGITQSKAAEVLNSIAASGDVASDKLQRYAQVAIEFERAGGGAADEVAKAFSSMAGDPLAAVEKLNKSTKFLTAEIYNKIKALEDEGRSTDAARVAQDAYASMMDQRIPKLKDNLGLLERGWMGVKDAAAEAWDSMLNVGRAQTIGGRLEAAQKLLADYESTLPGKRTTEQVARVAEAGGVNGLRSQIAGLQELMETQRKADEQQRANNQSTQAAINLSKQASQFDTDLEKQRKAVAQATEQYNTALAAGNLSESARAQLEKDYLKTVTGITAAKEQRATSTRKENKDIADQSRIFAELADVSSTYYADLEKAQQQRAKGNLSEAQYVKYVEELIQKQPFAVAGEKARAEAIKESAKAAAESSKALGAWYEVREKESQGLQNQINARREEVTLMGLSAEAVAAYTQAKYEQQAAEKEAYAAALESASFYAGEYADAYNIAAEAARQQAQQLRELGGLEVEKANKDAAKKAADEWQRAADDINRSLTDALMRGFESGKDFAKNLRDTVSNMFRTLVLRPIISAVMSPVSMAITGVMNSMGMGAASSMGTSLLGNIGSSALISGLGSSIAGAVGSSLGAIFGTGVGNVALGTTLGLGASSSTAAALAAAQAGGAATGGIASAGSLFSGIGAAMPWIAGIAALASILGGLDDSGTYHTGGAAQYSGARGLRTSLGPQDNDQFGIGMGWVQRGDQTISAVSAIAQGLGTALDGIAVAFGQKAGYEITTAFADDTSGDGAWGALRISKDGQELLNWQDTQTSRWAPKEFGDGEEGYKEYLAAVAKDTRQVLLDMDLPSWADKMLESIGESASMEQLTGVLTQIGVVQSAFVALGKSMEMFSGLTDEMQSGLMDAAGSIEALTAGAGAFYQGFYSEQERIDAAVAQLNETLAGLDLSIDPRMGDDAKDQFRAAVEAAFAAGDAELAAALLAISGNFASAADYFERLSETAAQAAETAAQAAEAAAQAAQDAALRDLQNAISRDRNALQDQASTLQETISGISSAVDMLRSNAADLYGTVQSTAQQLAAQGMVYVEQALAGVQAGGSVLDYTGLEGAISAARGGIESGTYASQFERERDALVLAGQLNQLGDLSDLQLSVEERQLKAVNDQIEYLDSLNDRAQAMVDGTAALTESVDTYFQQLLDLMKEPEEGENKPLPVSGIGGGGGFSSGPGSSAPVTPYNPIDDIKDLYNQTLDPAALRTTMWIRGWTVEQMAEAAGVEVDWARDYLNQDLPKFAVGTNYVPKDMAAIVHEGEAIVPKAFNPWANGGAMGSDTSALIAEVRALREEVAALRASGQAIAENTSGTPQMVRQFDQVTQGGNVLRNKAIA